MTEPISPDDEKALADCLKREAEASRPAFSEGLHARIRQEVAHGELHSWRRPAARPLGRRWISAAVAATCVVSASLVAWQLVAWHLSTRSVPEPGPPEVTALVSEPADPLAGLSAIADVTDRAEHVGMLVYSSLTTQQWAYLDHDARIATRMLIDQWPLEIAMTGED